MMGERRQLIRRTIKTKKDGLDMFYEEMVY